jgi:hypothetical protein
MSRTALMLGPKWESYNKHINIYVLQSNAKIKTSNPPCALVTILCALVVPQLLLIPSTATESQCPVFPVSVTDGVLRLCVDAPLLTLFRNWMWLVEMMNGCPRDMVGSFIRWAMNNVSHWSTISRPIEDGDHSGRLTFHVHDTHLCP